MQLIDIKGQKFGNLTVLSYAGRNRTSAQWDCQCDCGNIVTVVGNRLRNGHTKSCSCLQKATIKANSLTHGQTNSPEYKSWQAMKDRCYNAKSPSYIWYGLLGITVCERWLHSFENFIADMGAKPTMHHTIDRKDNLKGYSPSNCKWASKLEQGGNTSRNRWITFNGEAKILAEWARYFGISTQYFYHLERNLGENGALIRLNDTRGIGKSIGALQASL